MTPRNQVIAVAALLAIVGSVDFVRRVYVPRAPTTRDSQIESPAPPAAPQSLAMARQRLQSWFPAQTTGSMVQGTNQQGESGNSGASVPDRANIGGWQFVLRGVFDTGPKFAVLDVIPASGGPAEQHRLSVGEMIKGISVEQISGKRISLSDGEQLVQLALFIDPEDEIASVDEKE